MKEQKNYFPAGWMIDWSGRERTATDVMMNGLFKLRELSRQELEYWDRNVLPSFCSIIKVEQPD